MIGNWLMGEDQRWCIHIDIEGFSEIFEFEEKKRLQHEKMKKEKESKQSFQLSKFMIQKIGDLLDGIARIGREVYPRVPDRLFVHQIGDAFYILSNFGECCLERPISIAAALMQFTLENNFVNKAVIAEGSAGNYSGWFPKKYKDDLKDDCLSLGDGLLTVFNLFGTAIIRATKLSEVKLSGPLLILNGNVRERLPSSIPYQITTSDYKDYVLIDWLHMNTPMLRQILDQAGFSRWNANVLEQKLRDYCQRDENQGLRPEWLENVEKFLGVSCSNNS